MGLVAASFAVGTGIVVGVNKLSEISEKQEELKPEPKEVYLANRPIEAKCKDINSIVSVDLRRNEHGEPKAAVVYCKPAEPTK